MFFRVAYSNSKITINASGRAIEKTTGSLLQILELASVCIIITRWQIEVVVEYVLNLLNCTLHITPPDIESDKNPALAIFMCYLGRSSLKTYVCDLS